MSISGSTRTGFVALATAICALGMAMLIAGCQTKAEHDAAFKTALNTYYSGHQDCLWSNPVKFPESADTRKADQLKEFDALVDAGLLQRTGGTEARHARHEERRREYALSDIGRLDWTADQARSGYGNFCFGHPQVNAIESYSKVSTGSSEYDVSFRDSVTLPAWATIPQVKQAFPKVANASTGQAASATVVKNSNGWQVMNVSPASATPMG